MSNIKISALPTWTGTSSDIRWFVMNNQEENETYKFSGYSTSITYGTGTNSIKSANSLGATGNGSIAIGLNTSASGDDAVVIGNSNSSNVGYRSISIGRHPYPIGDSNVIMGSGAYCYGNNSILIGHETSTNSNGIVIGSNTSRAGGQYAITIGHSCEQNNSVYSTILGYNNQIGLGPNYLGSPYSVVIGTNHNVETDAGYNYNTILGGEGNYITGATSGVTILNLNNFVPTRNDAGFIANLVVTNYAALNFPNDSDAAAGGVVLGQLYHHNGAARIRIS